MGNQDDHLVFLPFTDSFENVAGYVQGLLNKAIADTNAGITAVGVASPRGLGTRLTSKS